MRLTTLKSPAIEWSDSWWSEGFPHGLGKSATVFHGSLGNADRIARELGWCPGTYCDAAKFCCSAWYEGARPWLLHTDWRILPADDLVATAPSIAAEIGGSDRVFVRPDSPLKPFSGRVVDAKQHGVGELGYWVRTPEAGKGVATLAIQQIAHWAFEARGLHRLGIIASVQNVASQRAAEKAGAVREGILRERLILNGVRHDAALFAILKH